MENYEKIYYRDCPHFTIGRVDQWGENGYLFFDGNVYRYEVDRKEQQGSTTSPRSVKDFLKYTEEQQIEIPPEFLKEIAKILEDDRDRNNRTLERT